MANYSIGKCTFNDQQWKDVDLKSREEFKLFLSSFSKFSNIGESSGNCSWDISCLTENNISVVFELKDRNYTSDRFGDIMVEFDKYTNNKKYCPNYKIIAVNFYRDGVFAFCEMNDETMNVSFKNCPRTTMLAGCRKDKVVKKTVTLPQMYKFKKINNKWRKI
jgi:hypothetical protein